MFNGAIAEIRPLVELAVNDDGSARTHFEIHAYGIGERMVKPQFGHGRGIGIVDHDAWKLHVLRDDVKPKSGIAHDIAEGDGLSVRGDDALDAESHTENVVVVPLDACGESVDDDAHLLVVDVSVVVGQELELARDDVAAKVDRAQSQPVGTHGHADCDLRPADESEGLCLASAGGFELLAFTDEAFDFQRA